MGKPIIEKSKETKRRINNDTKGNSKQQIVEKANECPEWLPDGWNVEIRTRKSGPNMGSEYKCYVDPLNEQKFYSKPEVLRYLETRKDNSCTTKKEKKCSNMRSPSKKEDKFTDINSQSKKEDECIGMHSPSKEEGSIKKVNKGKGENKCTNMHSRSKNEGSDTKIKKIKKEGKCTDMHSPSKNEDSIKKIEKGKEKDKSTDMHSPNNIVQKANDCLEWLPSNWDVEVRTRKSGPNKGSEYKCYIDPLNEHKFYSKPEVLRYLETRKENSYTPKKEKKCSNTHSPSKKEDRCTDMHSPTNKEDECTDMNSPIKEEGSIENVKRSKKEDICSNMHSPGKNEGKNEGSVKKLKKNKKEDTCNDMHSPSKNEEDSLKKKEKKKEEDKDTGIRSPSNAVVENSTAEDLPPGWIKEVKSRKNSNGGIKKDAFYTDPASGYVFRSIKDVLRYLESGDTSKCAIKPSRIQIQDGDNSTPSPPAKRQKMKQYAPEQQIFVAKEPVDKSSLELPGVQTHSLKDGAANPPEIRKTSDPGNHSISKNEFKVGHRSSRRLAGVEPVQLADNMINEQTLQVPKRNLRKNRTSINTSDTLSEVVFEYQPQQPERDKIENNKSEIHTDVNKSAKVKERHIPCRVSKRLAGSEPELMNSISHEKAPKYRTRKSKEVKTELRQSEGGPVTKLTDHATIIGESGNKKRKSPKFPPADNKLEKTEDDDEKLEPLSFAFHYSWSDPSLEFAINTLTGVLLPVENSVDNGPSNVSKTDIQKPVSDNVTGSRNKQSPSVSGPATVPESSIEKSCFNNVTGRRDNQNNLLDNITESRDRNPPVQSNKSKRKKEVKVPMRLSKRLAGLEPEVRPSERPLEYSTKKSCTEKPTATAILSNGASDHLYAGKQTKPTLHAPDSLKTEFLIESSSKSEKSYDANITRKEQPLEKVEAENIGDDRSEPQLSLPFGESWSDPCIEFAFKTLTGALPVGSAEDILPFMTPNINSPRNNVLHGRVTSSINGEAHFNSNQSQNTKELNMDSQPSKLLPGQPELKASSTSGKNAPIFTTGEPHRDESKLLRSLDGEPIYIEAENATQLHHSRTNINSRTHEEPLKKNGQVAVGEFVPTEQPPLQTELLNHDNTELQFCDSFMNSWSDPCLEFAFKTLTGVIPVEENLVIQGRNQEPAKHHEGTNGGSTLPEFGIGSSSFSQSDMLFNYDRGVKSMPGQQQSSTSSPFPSFSLQNYPGVDPQNHSSPFNNNFQRR